VIAIIGILIALLLPAVQAAREAARRAQCNNNLKQIGLAMHSYHDTNKCFPPGNLCQISSMMQGWLLPCKTNWAISLLPYLELQTLYERYDNDVPNTHPSNAFVREQLVPVYCCPADWGAEDKRIPATGPGRRDSFEYRHGSYRAMAGRSDIQYITIPDRGCWIYSGFQVIQNDHPEWKGLFHVVGQPGIPECERMAAVTDGTSNTIAVGERHASMDYRGYDTFWANSVSLSTSQAVPLSQTLRVRDFWGCVASVPNGKACDFGWNSYHPGGLNWLMCDGSVHFLDENINMYVFCDLSTIAGGEDTLVP